MPPSAVSATSPFRAVIMGSDLGVYSLARAFHEAYGTTSVVVAQDTRGPIVSSAIIDPVYTGADAGAPELVEALLRIARENAGTSLILLAGGEDHLDMIEEHRAVLEPHYLLPYPDGAVLRRARDKRGLYEACAELDLPFPAIAEVDVAALAVDPGTGARVVTLPAGLSFPVAVKPANSGEWSHLTFPGKKKAYWVPDAAELTRVLTAVADGGYRDQMLIQEFVPGDDTWGRTVTCYVASNGEVTLAASGILLLGMHTPSMIGNSVAILTRPQPELCEQVTRLVGHLGLRGFVNVDLKVDPRDGVARFLDLNARAGRPNHYALLAGLNPARAVVEDLVDGEPRRLVASDVSVFSYLPRWFLLRYVTDPDLRRAVRAAWPGAAAHPLVYAADRNPRRFAYRTAAMLNVVKAFWGSYRRPRSDGF